MMGLLFGETKKPNSPFVCVNEILCVYQQGKGSDITALHVMQEVGECCGMSANQGAQLNKTLTEREEEMSALLTQHWTQTFCR